MLWDIILKVSAVFSLVSAVTNFILILSVSDEEKRKKNFRLFALSLFLCAGLFLFGFSEFFSNNNQSHQVVQNTTAHAASSKSTAEPFCWLEDIVPNKSLEGNLFIGKWRDRHFSIEGINYNHGIGMYLNGTDAEVFVNLPPGNWEDTCGEVSVEYQIDGHYRAMSFNIGADDSEPRYYGSKNTHGVARIKISDAESDVVLFDTDWFDYTYAAYDVQVELADVKHMRIALQACGGNDSEYHYTLNVCIVDAKLYLN
jgi:hypothetical protein